MSRTSGCIRLLELLGTTHVISKETCAEILEVNVRNIVEYRKELELCGYQIESIHGRNGGLHLIEPARITSPLDEQERQQLKAVFSDLLSSHEPQYTSEIKQILVKLVSQLGDVSVESLWSGSRVQLNIDSKLYWKTITICRKAVKEQTMVKFSYRKADGQIQTYELEPYYCYRVDGLYYVEGLVRQVDQRVFKLNRVLTIEATDHHFYRRDMNASYSSHGIRVKNRVELTALVKNNSVISEYIWGDRQEIEWRQADQFKIKVIFPNAFSCLEFIRRCGESIQVIGPDEIRKKAVDQARMFIENNMEH